MSLYLDASVLVALVVREDRSSDARRLLTASEPPIVSTFAALELASAVSRKVRIGELSEQQANAALGAFEIWSASEAVEVRMSEEDIAAAAQLLRRFSLKLRTGDSLHVAMAFRLGADLATFDDRMGLAAVAAGLHVVP